ncbi:hypothetical protein G6011_08595 [Alternaria panax]|uniref:Uncharacterized protein n=1 Tax=Alternaria panax TaxID=48097 RepID=A0AAD4FI62_9PLEO|nr:hypothetical protein G6011_08595 [Alternaria panax]
MSRLNAPQAKSPLFTSTSSVHPNKISESTNPIPSVPRSLRNQLLDLPSELRDEVYTCAFGNDPRIFVARKDTMVYGVTSDRLYHAYDDQRSGEVSGLPIWLLGSKRNLAEAMDLFHRSRTYVFEDIDRCSLAYQYGSYKARSRPRKKRLSYGGKGNILSLSFQPGSK